MKLGNQNGNISDMTYTEIAARFAGLPVVFHRCNGKVELILEDNLNGYRN